MNEQAPRPETAEPALYVSKHCLQRLREREARLSSMLDNELIDFVRLHVELAGTHFRFANPKNAAQWIYVLDMGNSDLYLVVENGIAITVLCPPVGKGGCYALIKRTTQRRRRSSQRRTGMA